VLGSEKADEAGAHSRRLVGADLQPDDAMSPVGARLTRFRLPGTIPVAH
jgi:hypothetical protein